MGASDGRQCDIKTLFDAVSNPDRKCWANQMAFNMRTRPMLYMAADSTVSC
jgi:hypothetical protein